MDQNPIQGSQNLNQTPPPQVTGGVSGVPAAGVESPVDSQPHDLVSDTVAPDVAAATSENPASVIREVAQTVDSGNPDAIDQAANSLESTTAGANNPASSAGPAQFNAPLNPQLISDSPEWGANGGGQPPVNNTEHHRPWFHKGWFLTAAAVLALGVTGFLAFNGSQKSNAPLSTSGSVRGGDYNVTNISLSDLAQGGNLTIDSSNKLSVNGQLRINNSAIISPSDRPSNPQLGQMYLDRNTNQLFYYNGTQFVPIATTIGGLSGAVGVDQGITVSGQGLINTGVLSLQGQTGSVTLTAGNGISIDGTTIANTGVTALTGANGLTVSQASGNVTIGLPQNLSSTATPTFAGINLGSPLGILNGGTGAGSYTSDTLIMYNGTAFVSLANGSTGACLRSNGVGTAPTFQTCPGGGGGTQVSVGTSQTSGNLTKWDSTTNSITNSIVSDNGTTVSVGGALTVTGAVTGASFSGNGASLTSLNANNISSGTLAVLNGGTGASDAASARTNLGAAASGANTDITSLGPASTLTLGQLGQTLTLNGNTASKLNVSNGTQTMVIDFENPGVNVTYRFQNELISEGGVYEICTSAGNCSGTAGLSGSGTTDRLAKFTSSSTVSDSVLEETSGLLNLTSGNFSLQAGNYQINGTTVIDSSRVLQNVTADTNILTSGTLSIARGGTGAGTAAGARTSLGAAASGANGDISSLTAVTNIGNSASTLTVGDTSQQLILQGNASTVLTANGGGFTTTIGFSGTPTRGITYNFDRAPVGGSGTFTICTTAGNCVGTGGGVTASASSSGYIPVFTGAQTVTNSIISQNSSLITVAGTLEVTGGTNALTLGTSSNGASPATGQLTFKNASGTTKTTLQGGNPGTDLTFTLPTSSGSNGQCLTTNGSGILGFSTCLSGSGAGGGVTSLNSFSGSITIVGTNNQISIDTSTPQQIKLSTPQDINTTSNVTFGSLKVTGLMGNGQLEIGSSTNQGRIAVYSGGASSTRVFLQAVSSGGFTGVDKVISIPNTDGTVAVKATGNIALDPTTGTISFTGTLPTGNGGTGLTSFTANGVLYASSTSALSVTSAPTAGQILMGNGTGVPTFTTISGDISLTGAGVAAISSDAVALGNDTTGAYVATLSGGNGITASASGEGSSPTIALGSLTANWVQGGAFDIVLDNASSELTIKDSDGTNYGTIDIGNLTQDRIWTLPNEGTVICVDTGNCAGAGSGVTASTPGTVGKIALFSGTTRNIGDSILTQNSTSLVTVGGNLNVSGASGTANIGLGVSTSTSGQITFANSTNSNLTVLKSGDATGALTITLPTTGDVVSKCLKTGTGSSASAAILEFGNCVDGGSGDYIQNKNAWAVQTNAKIAVQTDMLSNPTILSKLAASQTSNLYEAQDGSSNMLWGVSGTGRLLWGTSGDTNLYRSAADTLKTDDAFQVAGATTLSSTLSVSGATTITASNSSVFKVQNASNVSILNADTTLSTLTAGANTADLCSTTTCSGTSAWNSASGYNIVVSSVSQPRVYHASVTYNGYVYVIGGYNSSSAAQSTVYYAKLNSDGTLPTSNTWSALTSLPNARVYHSAVVVNGYLYVIGGNDGSSDVSTVYYTKINSDGTIGASWSSASSLPAVRKKAAVTAGNGYIYVIGGQNGSAAQSTVYFAKPNPDGTIPASGTGSWTAGQVLSTAAYGQSASFANGYVYVAGGIDGAGNAQGTTLYNKQNLDGTFSTIWNAAAAFPSSAARYLGSTAIMNGYLYYFGGFDSSGTPSNTIYYASINSFGLLGSSFLYTASSATIPTNRVGQTTVAANGYIYLLGGSTTSALTSAVNTVFYTSTSRVKVQGSLDLIGAYAGGLSDSGSGGSLTAGNTKIIGSLDVSGDSNFMQGVNLLGSLSANGQAALSGSGNGTYYGTVIKNATNSTSAFAVQNSGGTNLISADTTNNIVNVGGGGGAINSWTPLNSLPASARGEQCSFQANGYYFHMVNDSNTYYSAKLNPDGTVGTWSNNTSGGRPDTRTGYACVYANGYVYMTGGLISTTVQNTVYRAPVYNNGTIGSWSLNSTTMNTQRYGHSVVVNNGYLYVLSGLSATTPTYTTSVEYAPLNADGSLGTFTTAVGTLPAARASGAAVAANGTIYFLGGVNGVTFQANVYYARPTSTGAIASFTSANSLGTAISNFDAVVMNGYLYTVGGSVSGSASNAIQLASLNSDGSLGTWTTSTVISENKGLNSATAFNGYIYTAGGNSGFINSASVYSASAARIRVGAALDLVGFNSGGSYDEYNGELTAGRTNIIGTLSAMGQAQFANNVSVSGSTLFTGTSNLFRPSSDSTAAFTIQNSSGTNLFNVDTSTQNITIGNNSSTQALQSWATNAGWNVTTATTGHGSVIHNGYIYTVGGTNSGGTVLSSISYSKLNADGTPQAWASAGSIYSDAGVTLAPRSYAAVMVVNGYLYVIGGTDGSSNPTATTLYAKINQDGTITNGSWRSTGALTSASGGTGVALNSMGYGYSNGYIYVVGGNTGAADREQMVYYAKPNADGTLSWTINGTNLPSDRYQPSVQIVNGYMYVMGGATVSTPDALVYRGKLNANGSISSWSTSSGGTSLPANRYGGSSVVMNGNLYYFGGWSGSAGTADYYYTKVNNDGTYANWTTVTSGTPASGAYSGQATVTANGYVYFVSGATASPVASVYVASSTRIRVAGALDLVGAGTGTLAESGAGGELTAGNTRVVGDMNVQGNASFAQNAVVNGALTVNGTALFTGNTFRVTLGSSAADAFLIEKSDGTDIVAIDTSTTTLAITATVSITGQFTVNGHIVSGGTAPTVAGTGAGMGTGSCTGVITGNDTAGRIALTTGTGSAAGQLCSFTFNSTYGGSAPRILISGVDQASAAINPYAKATSGTAFEIGAGTAPADGTPYIFEYFVIK